MDLHLFNQSLKNSQPDASFSTWLQALWYDAKGNWEKAHELIQDLPDQRSAHLHAYLHRKEGDEMNAGYWYRKAGVEKPRTSLQEEWEALVRML